uniref:Uncharacterized protein n=1 Tax=Davidia involucrata TaxID=16924 RepID=A0A5B7B997_DAVIN
MNRMKMDSQQPCLLQQASMLRLYGCLYMPGANVKLRNKYGKTAITLSEVNKNSTDVFEKVILEYALAKGNHGSTGFYALHHAACRKRNVICRGAKVGPSSAFCWNHRKKFDADEPGVFRVITTKNKEVHFVCEGGIEMAKMWVRGIKLVTREAIFGSCIEVGRSLFLFFIIFFCLCQQFLMSCIVKI